MSDEIKMQIAIMTNNTIRIGLFVLLAIVFDRWWIMLFSLFFMLYYKDY